MVQHRRDRLHHADADGAGQWGLVFNRSRAVRQRRRIVLGGGAGGCHGLWCHRVSGAAGADATDRHGLLCVGLITGTDPDWRGGMVCAWSLLSLLQGLRVRCTIAHKATHKIAYMVTHTISLQLCGLHVLFRCIAWYFNGIRG